MKRLHCLFLVLLLLLAPRPAHAQDTDWRERRTDRFAILYVDGDAATAEHYADFVDGVYDEVAAIFSGAATWIVRVPEATASPDNRMTAP